VGLFLFSSHGVNKEVYCNEYGFPWENAEWFTPPPVRTPQMQAASINTAIARLPADGMCKGNIFNAGGDSGPYSLIDEHGKPRPAYAALADYLQLASEVARRLDISATRDDRHPMDGIYTAAAINPDGSATVIINPAECAALQSASDSTAIAVRIRLPMKATSAIAKMSAGGKESDLPVQVHGAKEASWADVVVPLIERTVVHVIPNG
jgi:hypothetical protein